MTKRQESLARAGRELNLKIEFSFNVNLPDGRCILADAWLPDLGAPKGIIVVRDYDLLLGAANELIEMGYGFSVLEEPSSNTSYDRNSYVEMFSDWGWAGEEDSKPIWMG